MAYVPQFENDIYISYARADNATDPTIQKGWADAFHNQLETELNKLIGRAGAIKIWRDAGGAWVFKTDIERAIKQSAIFVVVISKKSLLSGFSERDVRTFYDTPERGGLANHSRTFFVKLQPSILTDKFKENSTHKIFPYAFYDEVLPMDNPGRLADPGSHIFQKGISLLAGEIFKTLQLLKDPKLEEIHKPVKSAVFISYRRGESTPYAGRLYDQLAAHFGDNRVFIDLDTIEPGDDFVEVITNYVSSCSILIALINKTWLEAKDDEGRRRLDNPDDFVNLEISIALQRKIRVIPVLVQGASMPRTQELPQSLSPLSRRNALEVSDLRWKQDVGTLIKVLEKYL